MHAYSAVEYRYVVRWCSLVVIGEKGIGKFPFASSNELLWFGFASREGGFSVPRLLMMQLGAPKVV